MELHEISASELRQLLTRIKDKPVESEIISYYREDECIEIRNCNFNDKIFELQISPKLQTVSFVSCKFTSLGFSSTSKSDEQLIIFYNCSLNELYINGSKKLSLQITDTAIGYSNIRSDLNELNISNESKGESRITHLQLHSTSEADESSVFRKYNLENLTINKLEIFSSKADININNSDIQIINCSLSDTQSLWIKKSTINEFTGQPLYGQVGITDSNIGFIKLLPSGLMPETFNDALISLNNSNANEFTITNDAKLKHLFLVGKSIVGNLNLEHGSAENIHIKCRHIGQLEVDVSWFKFDQMIISGDTNSLTINHLILRDGILSKGPTGQMSVLMIQMLSVSNILFRSFINQSTVLFSQVFDMKTDHVEIPILWKKPSTPPEVQGSSKGFMELVENSRKQYNENTLEINNSDLGKLNLIGCDFSSMKFSFKSSKIIEIFLAGTRMPGEINGAILNQQIGYNQLRKVYENRGDTVTSLEYFQKELNLHYESLFKKNNLHKRSVQQIVDLWTLRINKCTNNFGSNWLLALCMLIFPMAVIYSIHNYEIGFSIGSLNNFEDVANFKQLLSLFPEFIFPIHKADYIPETVKLKVTNGSRLWDALGKLWGSFMIYQFIQAFRKFGKK